MIHRRYPSSALRAIVLGVLALPMVVSAQIAPAPPEKSWREANDAVGQFKRGHADILKWEKENVPAAPGQELASPSLSLMTAEDAVRQAWRAHLDLVKPMNRIGKANVDLIAKGQWAELDPILQRKVDDLDELMEVAAQGRKRHQRCHFVVQARVSRAERWSQRHVRVARRGLAALHPVFPELRTALWDPSRQLGAAHSFRASTTGRTF